MSAQSIGKFFGFREIAIAYDITKADEFSSLLEGMHLLYNFYQKFATRS